MRPLSVEESKFRSELSKMNCIEYWDSEITLITEYGLTTDKDPYEPLTKSELAEFDMLFEGKLTIAEIGAMTPGDWERYGNSQWSLQYHTGGQYDIWYWYAREQHRYNQMMNRKASKSGRKRCA